MHAFIPIMGHSYEKGRNYDHGSGLPSMVSVISPHIRHRLVTEAEVLAAALTAHGPDAARLLAEEVIWREYFKGWLERRPQVWDSYVQGLQSGLSSLKRDRRLRCDVEFAECGQTGLECFDACAQELVEPGYLHNHARMLFASIWISTLDLPWQLWADFFYRHLLNGDAAFNTLGWRWRRVCPRGANPIPARAQNIATLTSGLFTPRHNGLAEVGLGLEATKTKGLPTVMPLRQMYVPQRGLPTALLVTDLDYWMEDP